MSKASRKYVRASTSYSVPVQATAPPAANTVRHASSASSGSPRTRYWRARIWCASRFAGSISSARSADSRHPEVQVQQVVLVLAQVEGVPPVVALLRDRRRDCPRREPVARRLDPLGPAGGKDGGGGPRERGRAGTAARARTASPAARAFMATLRRPGEEQPRCQRPGPAWRASHRRASAVATARLERIGLESAAAPAPPDRRPPARLAVVRFSGRQAAASRRAQAGGARGSGRSRPSAAPGGRASG